MATQRTVIEEELRTLNQLLKERTKEVDDLITENARMENALTTATERLEVERIAYKELAESVSRGTTLEQVAGNPASEFPVVPLITDKDRDGFETVISHGKVHITEEKDENGRVVTPGMIAFRRRIQFKEDSAYGIDSIRGRVMGTVELLLSPINTGPINPQSGLPSFKGFPPFNAERTLDVLIVIK